MPDENKIELSGSGLKVSYLRFLADGAAGLVIILLVIIGYYYDFFPGLRAHTITMGLGRDVKVFLLLIALGLAIPMGLGVNAFGWFLLGGLQRWGAGFWLHRWLRHPGRLTRATGENYSLKITQKVFSLDKSNFYEKANFYQAVLLVFHSFESPSSAHVKGINRLSRSLMIILFLVGIVAGCRFGCRSGWMILLSLWLVVVLLGLLVTLLEFYQLVGVLQKAYVIALEEADIDDLRFSGNRLSEKEQMLMKRLIAGGLPGRSAPSELSR